MKLPSRTVPDLASQLNFEKLERTVDSEPVTSLPTTDLYVGRRVIYVADAANGVYWDLVLTDPNATYPWSALGPVPLVGEVTTAQSLTNGTYSDLATVGPSVTLPLAGDYDVYVEAVHSSVAAGYFSAMSYAIGGTGASDADMAEVQHSANTDSRWPISRTRRKTGLTAVTLTAKYRNSSVSVTYSNRVIRASPVRVG